MSTVKVRIAVAVDSEGQWSAYGDDCETPEAAMRHAEARVIDDRRTFWLTAELPIPEAKEVAANVEGGK